MKKNKKGMAGWFKILIAVAVVAVVGAVGYFGATGELFQGRSFKMKAPVSKLTTTTIETTKTTEPIKTTEIQKTLNQDFQVKPLDTTISVDTKSLKSLPTLAFSDIYGYGQIPSEIGEVARFSVLSNDLAGGSLYDFSFKFTGCLGTSSNLPKSTLYLVKGNHYDQVGFSRWNLETNKDYMAIDSNGDGVFSQSEFPNLAGVNVPGTYVVVMDTISCTFDSNMPDSSTVQILNPQNSSLSSSTLVFG
jgi:hypothetical protein